MNGSNRVTQARESIIRLEEQVVGLREEIEFLEANDPQIQTDLEYRTRVLGEKTRKIQALSEEITVHQRTIIQNRGQDTAVVASAGFGSTRITRSKSAASDASLSKVAANIQQASRQAMSASRPVRVGSVSKPILSEEEQRRSVQLLLEARNWLITKERHLDSLLDSPSATSYTRDVHQEFFTIQSVRVLMEKVCDRRASEPSDIETLCRIVKFVASQQ